MKLISLETNVRFCNGRELSKYLKCSGLVCHLVHVIMKCLVLVNINIEWCGSLYSLRFYFKTVPRGFVWEEGNSPITKNVFIKVMWLFSILSLYIVSSVKHVFVFATDEVFRGHEPGQATNRTVSAADVVLYGVNLVLPLMSQDLLKVNLLLHATAGIWKFYSSESPEMDSKLHST